MASSGWVLGLLMVMMMARMGTAGHDHYHGHHRHHEQSYHNASGASKVEKTTSAINCTADEPYVAPPRFKACRIQYYVQVLQGDPSLNQMLFPPLNASYTGLFGHGELFAFNVTSGPERNSTLLGSARGFTIDSSYSLVAGSLRLIEVEYIAYDDGYFKGTFQIQGEIKALATNEVAIIGGTGSFRGARGYAFISRLLVDGDYRLFHHDVRFLR